MLQAEPKTFGSLKGTLYTLKNVGDKLPMHNHDETSAHVSFVLDGCIRVHGAGWEIIAKAGNFLDWKPGQAHEFVALEPNSRFLNIVKNISILD